MSKHVVNSNSSHHENAARVKRPAGRVAISLVLVLGTVYCQLEFVSSHGPSIIGQ